MSSDTRLAGLSLKGFQENQVSESVYREVLWPKLDRAIDVMLNVKRGESSGISYEETYSSVYRIVCQGYGAKLFEDIIHKKIDHFIDILDENLNLSQKNVAEYVQQFDDTIKQFIQAIQSIVSVFVYLSRCVIEGGLEKALYCRLNEQLISKHVSHIVGHLKACSKPFAVEPSVVASIITNLFTIDEEYAKLAPELFQQFIPGFMGQTKLCQLADMSREAKEMSQSLQEQLHDTRSAESMKRKMEDDDQVVDESMGDECW